MTTASVPARVALAGNPSDGFGGAVVGLPFRRWAAIVDVAAEPSAASGLSALVDAAVTVFGERVPGATRPPLRVRTTIPREVGLAGSSAVVIATLRVLADHHEMSFAPTELAELALRAEVEVLGVPAGLQDRLIQAHDAALHMDFRPSTLGPDSRSMTRRLRPAGSVPGFVAWRASASEASAVVHAGLADRVRLGDPELVTAAAQLATLADRAAGALERGDWDELGRAMDGSIDVRAGLVELRADHVELVEVVRSCGAPVNYAGSGGSVVGLHHRSRFDDIVAALGRIGAVVEPVGFGP